MRLLLVEDELALRTGLIDLLQSEGYRVTVAVDGPRGLERALEEEVDAIILDVMLPGMSGFEVCAELRRRGRRLPVLMLTARSQVEDRVAGLDCGADDYLVKTLRSRGTSRPAARPFAPCGKRRRCSPAP